MGKKTGSTTQKRLREIRKLDKQKAKEMRRIETRDRKAKEKRKDGNEDPDIAGIRPGPQPLPEQWDDVVDDE